MKILWHLGLGDAIACAAIVAKYASENKVVEIPCWKHNEFSVKSFFVNHPNVKIQPIKEFDEKIGSEFFLEWAKDANLKLGFYDHVRLVNQNPQLDSEDFIQWFYRQAGMPISEKDKFCPIFEASKSAEKTPLGFLNNYQFVHFDSERPYLKDLSKVNPSLDIVMPNKERSILSYVDILINAKEIHCIDSSFMHLVECLPTTGKLFYHKYARPNSVDYKYLKKDWVVIN